MTASRKKRGTGVRLSVEEARRKYKKLSIARHRLNRHYIKRRQELGRELARLQRECPHDWVRDEERDQVCAACGKELVTVPDDPEEIDEEYEDYEL